MRLMQEGVSPRTAPFYGYRGGQYGPVPKPMPLFGPNAHGASLYRYGALLREDLRTMRSKDRCWRLELAATGSALLCGAWVGADVAICELPLPLESIGLKPLSGDGSTVIGRDSGGTAARWRQDSGWDALGDFDAHGVDFNGSVICGNDPESLTAVLWTEWAGLSTLAAPDGFDGAIARAVAWTAGSFGGHVVGQLLQEGRYRAAYWRPYPSPAWSLVTLPPDAIWSTASDVAQNGVVAGIWQREDGFKTGFWSFAGSTYMLPGPNGSESWVWDTSPMGNVFVGVVPIPGDAYPFSIGIQHQACVWWPGGTSGVLRLLPNTQRAEARATSEWGRVIVGGCLDSGWASVATVWCEKGPVDLNRYLQCAGVSQVPWPPLTWAFAVSGDGSTILARGGDGRHYLITGFVPPTGPVTDLNWDGNTDGVDLGILLSDWGPCPSPCGSDFNADGAVDGNDLAQLLAKWGSCP